MQKIKAKGQSVETHGETDGRTDGREAIAIPPVLTRSLKIY